MPACSHLRPILWSLALAASSCSAPHIYWGDVHGHTSCSDGKGSVVEYFAWARDVERLDFAIVTDHDFGHAAPWLMPEETWRASQDAADASTQEGWFVAICGYEWTSQPKYWSGAQGTSEHLFPGPPRFFNHKNVYFPARIPYLFSAKNARYRNPDLLAAAVSRVGGLAQNNHPGLGRECRDQWSYSPRSARVIANTEIGPDVVWYEGKRYETNMERAVIEFLKRGGRTGFVGGSDTHEGRPAARTAVLATALTREEIFAALRARRCYAVTGARIELAFSIAGHGMGEEVLIGGAPVLEIDVRGTALLAEVAIVRDGDVVHTARPGHKCAHLHWIDRSFPGKSWYFVRVTQLDADAHGNPSRAWSSPIWVRRRASNQG